MDDKLKPNQEKRIVENCVESIMDDLDVYHFDGKLMNKYEKQLIEFFTKIFEEHSLFSPGFDFSNKKNIVNDKEKIKDTLDYIDRLIMATEVDRNDSLNVGSNADANLYTNMIKELEKIKKTLS